MRLVMRNLNEYLRQKRLDSGLSQLDVARVLGYASPQFVSNWERGLVSPPLETIAVLIELYKLQPSEVINKILAETRSYLESHLTTTRRRPTGARAKAGARTGGRKKSARTRSRREMVHA